MEFPSSTLPSAIISKCLPEHKSIGVLLCRDRDEGQAFAAAGFRQGEEKHDSGQGAFRSPITILHPEPMIPVVRRRTRPMACPCHYVFAHSSAEPADRVFRTQAKRSRS